jgi:hypothetical protein
VWGLLGWDEQGCVLHAVHMETVPGATLMASLHLIYHTQLRYLHLTDGESET